MTQPHGNRRTGASGLSVAVIALSLAILLVAQSYLLRPQVPPVQGKMLFIVGLLLAWAALASSHSSNRKEVAGQSGVQHVFGRSVPLLMPTVMLAIIAALYASRMQRSPDALAMWLLSLVLFVAPPLARRFAAVWHNRDANSQSGRIAITAQSVLTLGVLIGVMCFAAYLRTFDLSELPRFVHGDEAGFGLDARALRDGKVQAVFSNGFQDIPRLTGVLAAITMTIWSDPLLGLRLSSVIMGLLTLPFLYLLARFYVSRPIALLVIFLLAVSRVDIHFSRVGLNNIQVAPLTVASMYFLLRGIRHYSLASATVAGLLGGLALYSYFSARLVPFLFATVYLFVLIKDYQSWRDYVKLGLASLFAALVVFAPQLGYFLGNLRAIIGHQQSLLVWNNIGHLTGGDKSITLTTLMTRQVEHALWGLNYYSDTSGQYGAQGPIIDTLTGILFFLGLLVCLRRWRATEYFALLAWYVLTNLILVIPVIGAPNAPRLLGFLPAVCLMAGIAVQRIGEIIKEQNLALLRLASVGGLLLVPVAVFSSNYQAYFQRYLPSKTYEVLTEIAYYLKDHGRGVTAYGLGTDVNPDTYMLRLMAPTVPTGKMQSWNEYLPLRSMPQGDALFFAVPSTLPALNILREYYPQGVLEQHYTPKGQFLFATYRVRAEEIGALKGLLGTYKGSQGVAERKDAKVAFDWSRDVPPDVGSEFAAQWDGSLFVPEYGSYVLTLEGSGEASVHLDGQQIITKKAEQNVGDSTRTLAKGWHVVCVEQKTTDGSLRLYWQSRSRQREVIPPDFFSVITTANGLLGSYYQGTTPGGVPVIQTIDPALFTTVSPYAELRGWGEPFSVTWTGTLNAPVDGAYALGVSASEGSLSLRVDGQTILDFGPLVHERRDTKLNLSAGKHLIEVTFIVREGKFRRLELWWAPPGQQMTPVPPSVLMPSRP